MFYSVLEKHLDGSYWYHGNTFENKKDAEKFMSEWIPWDINREKIIIEHTLDLPNQTCCTFDFHKFQYAGEIICTI